MNLDIFDVKDSDDENKYTTSINNHIFPNKDTNQFFYSIIKFRKH